jgi:hypothetical protein
MAEEREHLRPELIGDMVADIPEKERDSARAELLAALAGIYRKRDIVPPPWLAEVNPEPEDPDHVVFIHAVAVTETVRFAIRRAAWVHPRGMAGVAQDTGVSVDALNGIVSSVDMVSPETWEPLAALSYAQGAKAPHPSVVGLGLAVADLPAEHRKAAREALTTALTEYLRTHSDTVPGWLQDEAVQP